MRGLGLAGAVAGVALLLLAPIRAGAVQEIIPQTGEAFTDDSMSFDGTWQGTVKFDKEAFLAKTSTPATGTVFRLEIHGPVVRVFYADGDAFQEAKSGSFHVAPVAQNAVIFATDMGSGWVESWVFTVTLKDSKAMLVEYTRLVNNTQTPSSAAGSKFATRGEGEFFKVGP